MLFVCQPKLPRENWRQCLCKILGWQTKSIVVCYGIFCSGQYMCLHAFKKSVRTLAEKSQLVGQTVRLENEIGLFFSEFTLLYTIWLTSWLVECALTISKLHPHQCHLIILNCQLPPRKDWPKERQEEGVGKAGWLWEDGIPHKNLDLCLENRKAKPRLGYFSFETFIRTTVHPQHPPPSSFAL